MKRIIMLIACGVAFLLPCRAGTGLGEGQEVKGTITVSATPDMLELTGKWADEFAALHPKLNVNVVGVSDSESPLGSYGADLAIVTGDHAYPAGHLEQWTMIVGREVLVPVVSSGNPYLETLKTRGVTPAVLSGLVTDPGKRYWENLAEEGGKSPVHFYLTGSESVRTNLAGFLRLDPDVLRQFPVTSGAEMASALDRDPLGLGFCSLSEILGENMEFAAGLCLLPVDKNMNGRMDYMEQIYENVPLLLRGIWIGKYPKELSSNVYLVAREKPADASDVEFVKYVLTGGQRYLEQGGLNSLASAESHSKVAMFPVPGVIAGPVSGINILQLAITIAAALLLVFLIAYAVRRNRRNRTVIDPGPGSSHRSLIHPESLSAPNGLLYDKSHTWAFMEKNGLVRIGMDDFIQHVTGPLTRVKLKNPGDKVRKGEPVMTIVQKGKQLTISAPVSGIIRAENTVLFTDTSLINDSPYATGWIYLIEPVNWTRETQYLLIPEKYKEWIKGEFLRMKDFLARSIQPERPEYAPVILQDGGELKDHVLADLGPEVWEDFQTKFIDAGRSQL